MSEYQRLSEEEREELIAYLDGELAPETARAVEEKLQRDPVWRREAELLQTAWDMLDYLPQARASASFTEQTLTILEATRSWHRRQQNWWPLAGWSAWAMGLVLAAALGYGFGNPRQPVPEQESPWPPPEEVLLLLEHRDYWYYYEKVGAFSFLRQLDQADLFEEGS